jgi:alpha-methylacyl-CoA racemase
MPLRSALKGIRVLDLTSNLPGPLGTQILGDLGADVIKIESPNGDLVRQYPPFIDSVSVLHLLLNRNKRSIAVNLKEKEGLNLFYQLVKTSDVLIEGFRPGTTKRLKIDFKTLLEYKSDIIYCSITGYGSKDTRSGHDLNYVASTGITNLTGLKEVPTPIGVPIGDIGGGSLPAVIAILAGLLQRKDKPQHLNISITDQLIPWLTVAASTFLAGLGDPQREDHTLSGYNPFYRLYRTNDADCKYISFAPLEAKFWKNFCLSIDRRDLLGKQFDFYLLNNELPSIFLQKSQMEWEKWFEEYDIPGAPVLSLKEALSTGHRLIKVKYPSVGEIPLLSSPFLCNGVEISLPPKLGEHSKEIIEELGLIDKFNRLKRNGVIVSPD